MVVDLGFTLADATTPLTDLAAGNTDGARLLRAFLDKRDNLPEPDENILERLAANTPPMYPMRRGNRQRGLTWFDAKRGIVWLTAAHHAHDSGATTDSYVYFRSLQRADLIPDREDMLQFRREEAYAEADAIWDELSDLIKQAAAQRGTEARGHVGRVPVGLVMTDDMPPHMYVAVSRTWERVGINPPPRWLVALLSKCFRHEFKDADHLPVDRAMPDREAEPDEDIFSNFVSDWPPPEDA